MAKARDDSFVQRLKNEEFVCVEGWMFQILDDTSGFEGKDAEIMKKWLIDHSEKLIKLKQQDEKTALFKSIVVRENDSGSEFSLQIVYNLDVTASEEQASQLNDFYADRHRDTMLKDLDNLSSDVRDKVKPSFNFFNSINSPELKNNNPNVHIAQQNVLSI